MTYSTLKERINALEEPERSSRRMLYSDSDWDNLWELNAYPHQLPPLGEDWTAWTIIGPRGTGATTAGLKWMEQKFFGGLNGRFLIIVRHEHELSRMTKHFYEAIDRIGNINDFKFKHDGARTSFEAHGGVRRVLHILRESTRTFDMAIRGMDADYVWADEIENAQTLMHMLPTTKQFVFTQPTKLPTETLLSRAGQPRAF